MTIDVAHTIHLDLPASYRYLNVVAASLQAMLERAEQLEEPKIVMYNTQLAVQEICTNIVGHAYAGMPDQRIAVMLALTEAPRHLVIELRDTGTPFDQGKATEPDLEEGQIGGYGLFLVQKLMDEMSYSADSNGNCWRLVKYLA